MMKKIYIVAILFTVVFFSCEEESDIQFNQYVVNSFFSEGVPFLIQTTNTVSVFDTATYFSIKDMEGELYEDSELVGDLVFQDSYEREGFPSEVPEGYSVNGFTPQPGKEYRFELRHGEITITGSDIIPDAVDFTITDTSTVLDDYDLMTEGIECLINFNDPPNEDNYYLLGYNVTDFSDTNDDIGWTQAYGWMKSDDPAIENSYYQQGLLFTAYRFIFSDQYFNGKEYTIPVSFFVGHNSGRRKDLNIYLISISEQYYKYVTSAINQQENNDDYYAEPTQVYNNISNGFGIFAGFSVSKYVMEFGVR